MNNANTQITIDIAALEHNLGQVRGLAGPEAAVLAVVKADAYGHGDVAVARALVSFGVGQLAVANVGEAVQLRRASINVPIVVLGAVPAAAIKELLHYNLAPVISDMGFARTLAKAARRAEQQVSVQLKVDTGMHRYGVAFEQAAKCLSELQALAPLRVEGVMTHLPVVAEDPEFTARQVADFRRFCAPVAACYQHVANSAALLTGVAPGFNMVRPGLLLYGLSPLDGPVPGLRPVLSLHSRVALLRDLQAGDGVSYGHTFVARGPMRVALVPIGYADGCNRLLSNRGQMLIRGQWAPIVGRVCMDSLMLDVTAIPEVTVDDRVTVIGKDGDNQVTVDMWAQICDTINYEVVCRFGQRLERIYKNTSGVPGAAVRRR